MFLHNAVTYFIHKLAAAGRTPQIHVSVFCNGVCAMLYFRVKFRSGVRNIPPGQGSHCTGVTLKHTVAYVGENSATGRRTLQNHVSRLRYRYDDL